MNSCKNVKLNKINLNMERTNQTPDILKPDRMVAITVMLSIEIHVLLKTLAISYVLFNEN
jgi:hypothetical protein